MGQLVREVCSSGQREERREKAEMGCRTDTEKEKKKKGTGNRLHQHHSQASGANPLPRGVVHPHQHPHCFSRGSSSPSPQLHSFRTTGPPLHSTVPSTHTDPTMDPVPLDTACSGFTLMGRLSTTMLLSFSFPEKTGRENMMKKVSKIEMRTGKSLTYYTVKTESVQGDNIIYCLLITD